MLNIEFLRDYCLAKEGASEEMPFGDDTLVFKANTKIFLLVPLNSPLKFNVKADPLRAIELREQHSSVLPGFHMNKKHWNTILIDGSIPDKEILTFIDDSYGLIKSAQTKSKP